MVRGPYRSAHHAFKSVSKSKGGECPWDRGRPARLYSGDFRSVHYVEAGGTPAIPALTLNRALPI
jgi:hypothetical protein